MGWPGSTDRRPWTTTGPPYTATCLPRRFKTQQLHTKVYSQFLGVDFTTDDTNISDSRSPDALNLITDAAGFPEKRPGWRVLQDYSCEHEERKIHGLHYAHIVGTLAIPDTCKILYWVGV